MSSILPFLRPSPAQAAAFTVADLVDQFTPHIRRKWAASTWAACSGFLVALRRDLGPRAVAELRPSELENWLLDQENYASDWTRQKALGVIKRAFAWGAADGLCERNPAAGLNHGPGLARRPVTAEEFQRLLRWAPRDLQRILVFLRCTGCRPGELAKLTWSHVDASLRVAVLPEHKTRKTQKTPKPRVIHLPPPATKLLAWLSRQQPTAAGLVFANRRGGQHTKDTLGKRLRELRQRAYVPADAKLYGLRHAFGTQAIVNGINPATVAELMGHNNLQTTQHYLHLAGQADHLQDAARRATLRQATLFPPG